MRTRTTVSPARLAPWPYWMRPRYAEFGLSPDQFAVNVIGTPTVTAGDAGDRVRLPAGAGGTAHECRWTSCWLRPLARVYCTTYTSTVMPAGRSTHSSAVVPPLIAASWPL